VLDDEEDYTDEQPDLDRPLESKGRYDADGGLGERPDGGPDGPDGAVVAHADPAPIERFRRTSVGTALAAGLLGLRDVLEPPRDETPAIVEDWAGGEPFNDPIVLRLDPDHPEDSIVMVRPGLAPKRPKP
jgi:hypothetical protein